MQITNIALKNDMLPNEIIIKRLAAIKYLFNLGVKQSKEVDSIAGYSLLSFHDSIEMFLLLVAEHNEVKTDNISFMGYWDKFPNLTLKESTRALKDRRVNIKHKGLFPSKLDVETSRVTATEFFEQNVGIQFGIDFSTISLIDLISYYDVRFHLEEAHKELEKKNFQESLEKAGIAFYELMHAYEEKKDIPFSGSIFSMGKKIHAKGRLRSYKFTRSNEPYASKEVEDIFERMEETLEKMKEVLKINSLGINYKQYSVFNLLTPSITKLQNGEYHIYSNNNNFTKIQMNRENCQFCIDFVLDSSLKLQEFDFDISQYVISNIENDII